SAGGRIVSLPAARRLNPGCPGSNPTTGTGRLRGPFRVSVFRPVGRRWRSLQLGRLAQLFGAVGLFPRERGGGVLLAGAVDVGDLLRLAAEVAVGRGGLVDRVLQVEHL